MLLTAHGGALGTRKNTIEYLEKLCVTEVGAIEVDVRTAGGEIVLGHWFAPPLKSRRVTLRTVFEYALKYSKRVNVDLKKKGLIKRIVALAKEVGVENLIYFTGSVTPEEIKDLDGVDVYVNKGFYSKKYPLKSDNLSAIKEYLQSFGDGVINGININYKLTDEGLWKKAFEIGLGVSVFTVDDPEILKNILKMPFENVTTNITDVALKELNRK